MKILILKTENENPILEIGIKDKTAKEVYKDLESLYGESNVILNIPTLYGNLKNLFKEAQEQIRGEEMVRKVIDSIKEKKMR